MKSIKVAGSGPRCLVDREPDRCPICHHNVTPGNIGFNFIQFESLRRLMLQVIYRCPNERCQNAFIGNFFQDADQYDMPKESYSLKFVEPVKPAKPDLAPEVEKLSPNFAVIFGQAEAAESYGLDQIAGVGYRKALEFLVKDFAISKYPDKAEQIKTVFLGDCIINYVDDANVKTCAARATWLGNDETHYVRKWEEKDIKDLKLLIKLTVAWILNSVLTEKYLKDMPPATVEKP